MERLQKYMASCGVASRRKCEEYILDGRVKVNHLIINSLGTKVDPEVDYVEFDGKYIVKEENKVYFMLNKPLRCITTVKDEKDRETVIEIVKCKERIFPIGRLDYMTSGLLLLTNDGNIYNKIMHPRVEISKIYVAKVQGVLTNDEIKIFRNGVDIGDYMTAPCNIEILKCNNNVTEARVEIHEGKNRQIRRMFDAIGHSVLSLNRIKVGKLTLGDLKYGEYRKLTESEIKYLNQL